MNVILLTILSSLGLVLATLGLLWLLVPSLTGLPWRPSSPARIRRALALAQLQPGERLYDLGIIIFVIFTWFPEGMAVAGILIGYLCILIVHKLDIPKIMIKDIILLTTFILISSISYFLLLIVCHYPLSILSGDGLKVGN